MLEATEELASVGFFPLLSMISLTGPSFSKIFVIKHVFIFQVSITYQYSLSYTLQNDHEIFYLLYHLVLIY